MTYDRANSDLVKSPMDPAAKGNDTSVSMEELLLIREKYKQLVEHAPAGIYEVDLPTTRFIRVNDIMCQVGYQNADRFLKTLSLATAP